MFDDLEYEDECRMCGHRGNGTDEKVPCDFCQGDAITGRVNWACPRCKNKWKITRSSYHLNQIRTCNECQDRKVGECIACNSAIIGSDGFRVSELIICRTCYEQQESVWCPKCEKTISYSGYLRFAFWDDMPGRYAAICVTHYRHEHIRSYDRAWSNPRYARAIPGYNRDLLKVTVNNRAKRQLIRAISKHVREDSFPALPVSALEFVQGFERLMQNDAETTRLIVGKSSEIRQACEQRPRS